MGLGSRVHEVPAAALRSQENTLGGRTSRRSGLYQAQAEAAQPPPRAEAATSGSQRPCPRRVEGTPRCIFPPSPGGPLSFEPSDSHVLLSTFQPSRVCPPQHLRQAPAPFFITRSPRKA